MKKDKLTTKTQLAAKLLLAAGWISVNEKLPKHMEQCVFKLNTGNLAIGKCRYFEHGDSDLVETYGKDLSTLIHTYRNWELHNFDKTEKYTVTHWASLAGL